MTTSSRAVQQVAEARRFIASGEARSLRESLDLSLFDVASSVAADPSAIGRWERDLAKPRGPSAIRYVRFLRRLQEHLEAKCPPAA